MSTGWWDQWRLDLSEIVSWCWERSKAREKGTTEDEMAGWHHWLDGHEFEQVPRVGDGQGNLECCSPWGHRESDTTEWLNWLREFPWCNQIWILLCIYRGFPGGMLVVKNMPANAGDKRDMGSIPGFGRSPGGGHGHPLQCSCLENPMDREAWQAP